MKALTSDGESRDRLFELLERHLGEKRDCDLSRGRRGMELWSMGVLTLLKEGLNYDFDRLHHMANHDALIRLMLEHTSLDAEAYHRQTLIDNVSLVTPQLIGEISQLVVGLGHEVVRKKPGAALSGRVDSFVVETDVAHPTWSGPLNAHSHLPVGKVLEQRSGCARLAAGRTLATNTPGSFRQDTPSARCASSAPGRGGLSDAVLPASDPFGRVACQALGEVADLSPRTTGRAACHGRDLAGSGS